jgi:hypothetical protein
MKPANVAAPARKTTVVLAAAGGNTSTICAGRSKNICAFRLQAYNRLPVLLGHSKAFDPAPKVSFTGAKNERPVQAFVRM